MPDWCELVESSQLLLNIQKWATAPSFVRTNQWEKKNLEETVLFLAVLLPSFPYQLFCLRSITLSHLALFIRPRPLWPSAEPSGSLITAAGLLRSRSQCLEAESPPAACVGFILLRRRMSFIKSRQTISFSSRQDREAIKLPVGFTLTMNVKENWTYG